jgi:O-acetylserine/cysteine efflux transporter
MKRHHIVLATLPPVLWALAYTLAKPVMAQFPPLLMTSIAYALTAAVLFRPRHQWSTPLWAVILAATLGASVQSALIFSGIARVPASTAILVVQSQVPFAVLASRLIVGERISIQRLAGIVIALAGIGIVIGAPAATGEVGGLLLIVLGMLSWGIAQGVIRATSGDPGARMMGAMSLIAAPQLLVLSLVLESGQRHAIASAGLRDWLGLVAFSLGGYAGAYAIWYGLLRLYRVDQVAPFAFLMPVVGVLAGAFLLGDQLPISALLGGGIILVGLGLVVRAPAASTTQTA